MIEPEKILEAAQKLALDSNGSPIPITPNDIRAELGYNPRKKYAKTEIHGLLIRHILLENGFRLIDNRHGIHYILTREAAANATN